MPSATGLERLLPRCADGAAGDDALDLAALARDGGSAALDRALSAWYPAPADWWRMNMIGTLNARIQGPDGTSDSISNRADRAILQHLRRASDAILVGAETVRQEQHAPTGGGALVIVTGSGELAGHRIRANEAAAGVLVLCPPVAEARVRATMPGAATATPPLDGEGRVETARLRAFLAARGLRRVVVEGGAVLAGQLLDAGAIDEACLTQAPVFGAAEAPGLPGSSRGEIWRRELVAIDELGFLYARLVREQVAVGAASAPAS